MCTEFLRKKWETVFMANDLSKDGYITIEDADIFADRFIKHHNMEGETSQQLKADFRTIWTSLFLFDLEKIDQTTFLKKMAEEYTENRAGFEERYCRTVRDCVDLFDVDKDGDVSENEFVIAMKCWGIESLDRKYVQSYPQIKPGYISKEVFADSWIAFHTNDDENKVDIEKPVLFGFRMIDHV